MNGFVAQNDARSWGDTVVAQADGDAARRQGADWMGVAAGADVGCRWPSLRRSPPTSLTGVSLVAGGQTSLKRQGRTRRGVGVCGRGAGT